MIDLAKSVVLITGAGKGSGRLLAQALAAHGARIAANDISPVNVGDLVEQINAAGGQAKAYIEDVAKKVGAQYMIKLVEDDFGQIDVLVNHAAVAPHVSLLDMDEWDWHRVLDVNLTGAFLMTQSVGRIMRAHGSGVILNLIPEAQTSVDDGTKMGAAFIASKMGLQGLSRQAAKELSPYGIQVYAVENTHEVVDRVMALLAEETEKP